VTHLRISYTADARRELFEAADFYDGERPGLGSAFLDAVADALNQIVEFPESSQIARGKIRRKVLSRFPYNLLYFVGPGEIRVLAVMHHKRRPSYWWGRR
jgi:toxin ParE1/3/4